MREESPRTVWFKAVGELCYRRLTATVHRLQEGLTPAAVASGVAIRHVHDADDPALVALTPDLEPATRRSRIERSAICLVAIVDGEPAGVTWSERGRAYVEYLDLHIELEDTASYGYELFVSPRFRGRRLGRELLGVKRHHLRDLGVVDDLSLVVPENAAALATVEGSGDDTLGTLCCLRAGSWRRTWWRSRDGSAPPFRLPESSG
ncbi:MAG: GNAT family N-acetyltransferase [Thermoanaerobaculia bacterium]|nr:GNAT family N-acetyltransferase [Thermoanaerobaculia bacterium]